MVAFPSALGVKAMLIDFAEPMVWLWLLSAVAAVLYGLIFNRQAPNLIRTFMKTAAVAGLALVVWQAQGPSFLLFALAASAVGDLLLAGPGEKRFMAGVVAFAIAHGCYIPLFLEFGAFKGSLVQGVVAASRGHERPADLLFPDYSGHVFFRPRTAYWPVCDLCRDWRDCFCDFGHDFGCGDVRAEPRLAVAPGNQPCGLDPVLWWPSPHHAGYFERVGF